MTQATAATVVHDLVAAGYQADAVEAQDGTWTVYASSNSGSVTAAAVASFASSHGVNAVSTQAVFT